MIALLLFLVQAKEETDDGGGGAFGLLFVGLVLLFLYSSMTNKRK